MTDCVKQLSAVMQGVTHVGKDDFNSAQKFKFRGIDAVLDAVGPRLREHGVIILPEVLDVTHTLRTAGDKTISHFLVKVAYHFATEDARGAAQRVVVYGEAMDWGDKGLSKAMSVALRIALIQMFAIPTGEPDPDSISYEPGEGQTFVQETRTVPEIRSMIVKHLQSNRDPAWTIDQIADDFKSRCRADIREATTGQLEAYFEMITT